MSLQRYEFQDVFQENLDGTLSPRRIITISGVTFTPDVTFGPGVVVGGIDFHKFKYQPIAAEEQNGALIIRGFFNQ